MLKRLFLDRRISFRHVKLFNNALKRSAYIIAALIEDIVRKYHSNVRKYYRK